MVKMLLMVLVMAVVTFILRMIPLTFLRKKIRSRFLYSLFYYLPYAVLSAMTFPYIFFSTGSLVSGVVGTIVAITVAILSRSLALTAVASCATVLVVNLLALI